MYPTTSNLSRIFIIIILLLNSSMTWSQDQKKGIGEVSGILLTQATSVPLPYATVALKDLEAKLIEGVITDEKGFFKIDGLPDGDFVLEIQYQGFEAYSKSVSIEQSHRKITLGPIKLKEDIVQLNEVVVTGEQSQLSLRLDKKVFNVGKDILSQSGSVTDVLGNVPSVAVSPSGVVSLRGNANVTILINGRRSGLTSNQALEQIPSDNVERVEVITNPSARYDAAGSAGIINIILKKNKKSGVSGQARIVTGIPTDLRLMGSLNYKTEKLNLFSNLGIRYTDYVGLYTTDQETFENGKTTRLNQRQDEDRHDDGRFFYFGADYYLNKHNTLTAAFLRNETQDTDQTDLIYDYFNAGIKDRSLSTFGTSQEERSYNQLEMNFTKTFAKEGAKFTIDLQYDFWDSTKDFDIETTEVFPSTATVSHLRTSSGQKNNDFAIQSDFLTPLGGNSKLEFGLKYENRLVENSFAAQEEIEADFQSIDGFTNQLDYDEQILGVYTQYGNQWGNLSYLLGLRYEHTAVEIGDALGEFLQTNDYGRLFPTLNIGYDLSKSTKIQASYSQRINRPSLWQLNPFAELSDFNSRFSGNPTLQPSFSDVAELGLLFRTEKFTLNPSLYYSDTQGNIEYFTSQNPEGVFLVSLFNIEQEVRVGMEVALSYNPASWLTINGEINAYQFEKKGQIATTTLDITNESWRTSWSLNIKPQKGLTFQSRFNFRGRFNDAQTRAKAVSILNLGLSKSLFKNRGTLIFNVTNVLNSNKYREEVRSDNFLINRLSNFNAARWTLSYVYKFNQKAGQGSREAKRRNRN